MSWWSNRHFDRPGGVESATPTAWVPQSKPFWLTETGCPAVDLGANQPNMFPDPKSSEGGLPRFSRGARDDLMQRRFAEAMISRFDPTQPDHASGWNPVSTVDGRRMVEPSGIHLWTWDARPFPVFPAFSGTWADTGNWASGHWLTGRLGGTSVEGLIRAILQDAGFFAFSMRAVPGHVDGFVIDDRMSARAAIEPLLAAFQIDALDAGTEIRFAGRARRLAASLVLDDLVDEAGRPRFELRRAQETELPNEIAVTVSDVLRDHRRTTVNARRLVGGSRRETRADLPVLAPVDVMASLAETWLQDVWSARETARFALPPSRIAVEPGDLLSVALGARTVTVIVDRVEDSGLRRIEARTADPRLYRPGRITGRTEAPADPAAFGTPVVRVLDIAHRTADGVEHQPFLAVFAKPWPGSMAVYRTTGGSVRSMGTVETRAVMGELTAAMPAGPRARFDRGTAVEVTLYGGHLASVTEAELLDGANLAAVRNAAGLWEVFQFGEAELTGASSYRLTQLLRAQGGSEDALAAPVPAGSPFVLLDGAVVPLAIGRDDIGRQVDLRVGPARKPMTSPSYAAVALTPSARGETPWSPAQLRARRDPATGDVALSWIRRSRVPGADAWTQGDAALGEQNERYRLEILVSGSPVRSVETDAPAWVYPAAQAAADHGGTPTSVTVRVAQLSATLGPGLPRTMTLFI